MLFSAACIKFWTREIALNKMTIGTISTLIDCGKPLIRMGKPQEEFEIITKLGTKIIHLTPAGLPPPQPVQGSVNCLFYISAIPRRHTIKVQLRLIITFYSHQ